MTATTNQVVPKPPAAVAISKLELFESACVGNLGCGVGDTAGLPLGTARCAEFQTFHVLTTYLSPEVHNVNIA